MSYDDHKTAVESLLGHKLMLAFEGARAPGDILSLVEQKNVGGFTLFRALNVESPAQVRVLTTTLQVAAAQSGRPPLLFATDQEGGQFVALGDQTTQFPGHMALGATGDPELARQVGFATGRELAAMGVNVNYAPDCDVNSNPRNPNVGIRAFGDDPVLVAGMGAAMIAGLQVAGVAATAKHFPGNGESTMDPHFGVPVLDHDEQRLEEVDFLPFQAAIEAGARLMMTAHVGLPALTGRADLPATLSPQIMHDLLRDKMGFEGLLISDALNMHAITQGAGQIIDIIAAVRAGVDLLLLTADPGVYERVEAGLRLALARRLLKPERMKTSVARVLSLKSWLATHQQPSLDVVGCDEHRRLEEEVARRSITLVRNDAGLLPLNPGPDDRIAVIMPQPADLTPADTSSYVRPALADAIREHHPHVDEFIVEQRPMRDEIAALREQLSQYNLIILGTISAHMQPEQARLAHELLDTGISMVTVAIRTPYDLMAFPRARTHICTYSIQPVAFRALAATLWGQLPFQGRLPVRIPGLYAFGHGITL